MLPKTKVKEILAERQGRLTLITFKSQLNGTRQSSRQALKSSREQRKINVPFCSSEQSCKKDIYKGLSGSKSSVTLEH